MTALLAHAVTLAAQAAGFSATAEGHHAQPGGALDYAISAVGIAIVLWVIYVAVARFLHPRETAADHIKRKVIEERP